MHTSVLSRMLVASLLFISQFNLLAIFLIPKVYAQAGSFSIITPYYGTREIRSYFDHNTPNYNYNDVFVRYDGQQWSGNVDLAHCLNTINCYDGHNGIDVGMVYEHVLAAADGIVWEAGWSSTLHNSGYGINVKIKHFVNGHTYSTRYAHLTTTAVEVGQPVKAGQIVGTSGSTGGSTGPHLHFDISICINTSCLLDSDFRAMDPFGWQPAPGAPVQTDPWALAQNPNGADSWCMWNDGEFVNVCNPGRASHPIPEPVYGDTIIVDDTINNTMGFTKGYNGNGNNICPGIDPGCREWWETNSTGWGAHTYRTITNGLGGNYTVQDNWAKWKPQSLLSGDYEIFVYVPENMGTSNDTFTWQAHFVVVDSKGLSVNKIVDEYIGEGQAYNPRNKWLSLGIHTLNSNSAVFLLDDGEAPDVHCPTGYNVNGHFWCRVAADAVKFVQVIHQRYLPAILKMPTSIPTPLMTFTPTRTSTPTRTPTPTNTSGPNVFVGEPNDSFETAFPLAISSSMQFYIYPSGDEDWFRFYIPNDGYYRDIDISLSSLPANYDLELFDPDQYLVRYSYQTGTNSEHITLDTTDVGGYWRVLVKGVSGANSATDSYVIYVTISDPYLSPPYPPP